MAGEISSTDLNRTIAEKIATNLDNADKNVDGKIKESIWNQFWENSGSKEVKENEAKFFHGQDDAKYITVQDAIKAIMTRLFNIDMGKEQATNEVTEVSPENAQYAKTLENPENWTTVTAQEPIPYPEDQKVRPVYYQEQKEVAQPVENKKVQAENNNPKKPGSKWHTQTTVDQSLPGYTNQTTVIATWTRQKDGTALKEAVARIDGQGKAYGIKTTLHSMYQSDDTTPIYEEKVRSVSGRNIKTTDRFDENGRRTSIEFSLKDYEKTQAAASAPVSIVATNYLFGKNSLMDVPNATSREIKNDKGEVVLSYKNGKAYNAKGTGISYDKAYDFLEKQLEKQNLTFVMKFE